MQTIITPQIANILQLTEKMQDEEKDLLIWIMFKKWANKMSSVQEIQIANIIAYIYSPNFISENNDIENDNKRKLGLWKDKITYIAEDFNEPIEDLAEYM